MKLIVTGGRHYSDRQHVFDALDNYHASTPITLLIHGAATGADALADAWAESRGVAVKRYPAKWTEQGNAAGPIRNKLMMAAEKPDAVMAFPGNKGTAGMCRLARAAGVGVVEA